MQSSVIIKLSSSVVNQNALEFQDYRHTSPPHCKQWDDPGECQQRNTDDNDFEQIPARGNAITHHSFNEDLLKTTYYPVCPIVLTGLQLWYNMKQDNLIKRLPDM